MVLSPMEPVAPSDGHVRTADAAALIATQWNSAHHAHQTIRPRPTPSTPPRKNPINRRQDDGSDKSIEPVHQPAMARE